MRPASIGFCFHRHKISRPTKIKKLKKLRFVFPTLSKTGKEWGSRSRNEAQEVKRQKMGSSPLSAAHPDPVQHEIQGHRCGSPAKWRRSPARNCEMPTASF